MRAWSRPGRPRCSNGGGAVPAAGKIIRAWYRRGGGRAGNVAAGMLTQLKPNVQGIAVTNPERAAGGERIIRLHALLPLGRLDLLLFPFRLFRRIGRAHGRVGPNAEGNGGNERED